MFVHASGAGTVESDLHERDEVVPFVRPLDPKVPRIVLIDAFWK
jgi:hypothetical protein